MPVETIFTKKKLLPIGTRVKFLYSSYGGPSEDGPECVYFLKGEEGVITGHGCREGYWVKWDKWPVPFGAELGVDFIEIECQHDWHTFFNKGYRKCNKCGEEYTIKS